MAIHKSKVSNKVTYHTSKSGSYTYLKVYYGDKIIRSYTSGPVKLKPTMLKVEQALTAEFLDLCQDQLAGETSIMQELIQDIYSSFISATSAINK